MAQTRTRDWSEAEALEALSKRLADRAHGNVATIPIAAALVKQTNGDWLWEVDIHVLIPGVTEYELGGQDTTLPGAIRRAYLALNNERQIRASADASNKAFGVTV